MDYISVKEAAKAWRISERRVRSLCADGRIEGAARHGDWAWSIPATTERPIDGRSLRFMKNSSFRTGAQNYESADRVKGMASSRASVIDSIHLGMSLDSCSISVDEIRSIVEGSIVPEQNLETHIMVRNIVTILSDPPEAVNEYNVRQCNSNIVRSALNEDRGLFRGTPQQHEFTTLMLQCKKDWAALNPIARAAFLLGEMLRIRPFCRANGATAVCAMQSALRLADYPLADIQPHRVDELKAALTSIGRRGNYQTLVSLILNSLTRQEQ